MGDRSFQNAPLDFQRMLDDVLRKGWPTRIDFAGLRAIPSDAGDPDARIDANPRLSIMLRGRQRYSISSADSRREVVLRAGQCLYWPGGAWSIPHWEEPCRFFGIVFRSSFTRYLMVDFPGGPPPAGATPLSCHLAPEPAGESQHILRALEAHAVRGAISPEVVRLMVLSLLHLASAHLAGAEEVEVRTEPSLWQRTLDYLHAHYADSRLSRASVAEALGAHPNYLSLLAKKQGRGFHEALEEIRIRHARHFLIRSGLPLEEIHRHCGYSSASYFQRAFRKATGFTPAQFVREFAGRPDVHVT